LLNILLHKIFIPRPLSGKGWIGQKAITIKLLINKSLKENILERTSEDNIKPYDKHRLLVNFPFVDDEHGYNLLLSYGDKCECLEPENVREELIKRINNLLGVYHK
jgi:predicted DNA-binding transcriptional regulator YafY